MSTIQSVLEISVKGAEAIESANKGIHDLRKNMEYASFNEARYANIAKNTNLNAFGSNWQSNYLMPKSAFVPFSGPFGGGSGGSSGGGSGGPPGGSGDGSRGGSGSGSGWSPGNYLQGRNFGDVAAGIAGGLWSTMSFGGRVTHVDPIHLYMSRAILKYDLL